MFVGRLVGWLVPNISRPWWSRNVWGPKHFATTMVAKCLGPTNQPTNKHFATTMVAKCLGPKTFRDHLGREMFDQPTNRPTKSGREMFTTHHHHHHHQHHKQPKPPPTTAAHNRRTTPQQTKPH